MRVILNLSAAAVIAMAAGACAVGGTTNLPYPTYGNPVNPTPVRGYRVQCATEQQLGYPVFDNMTTSCEQVIPPSYHDDGVVIEAQG